MPAERRVTASRLGRLGQLGRLAGGVAGGMVREGARRLRMGERPSVADMLLTPANVRRVTGRLSQMRGAAMKVGQLLSMDNGNLLPRHLADLLGRLREDAHPMPRAQVENVLKSCWGGGWATQFHRFDFRPIAAASIGQVHRAELKDGRQLAVKIQYPGIRKSIDSDVDNVVALIRLVNLLPEDIDIEPLLAEAKQQLHAEADYRREAACLNQFADALGDDGSFMVPSLVDELTRSDVLVMDFMDGQPIESLIQVSASRRNRAAAALLDLAVREVFEWGLVQTDPNFANFLYAPDRDRIQLLDFGATRTYAAEQRQGLQSLLLACLDGDDADVARAAIAVGYLCEDDLPACSANVVRLLRIATEPARAPRAFSFRRADLAQRVTSLVYDMRVNGQFGRVPPTELLFINRKLGGLYLLLARIDATVSVRSLLLERAWGQCVS